jgi:hypothetical protein
MADSGVSCETPIVLPLERSLYVGTILRSILYGEISPDPKQSIIRLYLTQAEAGLEIFTFFAAVYCISHRPPEYQKRQKFYLIYGAVLLSLTTFEVAFDGLWGQYMWIDHRNYPGGPVMFFQKTEGVWYAAIAFGASVFANILGDGLLVRHIFTRGTSKLDWNNN